MLTNKMPPIHPGEILTDELEALGLSANKFAMALHVPPNRISEILRGRRGLTADTALRLARYFGTTAQFWMNLQVAYDLRSTEIERGSQIEAEIVQVAQCA
jgi:addiction module HigA family antidote